MGMIPKDSGPECPECEGQMVKRKRKSDGEEFWGCAAYPECTGTRSIESVSTKDEEPSDLPSDRYRQRDRERWRS